MSQRIYTRCPACGNDTLAINCGHLLCTWHACPDPTLIEKPHPLSESAPASCSAWVECSSLPRDGESVLVVSRAGKMVVMYREHGVWVNGDTVSYWQPTHWMPLPGAPNSQLSEPSA